MLRKLRAAADAVGAALFAVLFVTFVVQVAARFAFDRPLPWSDELAVVLYVWVILWAAAVMVPAR
ncbi:MAG: TRAP transporter small permease subunit, partial [Betaproteobacteria bacterium]|nr:TRAP transporter small permease subunit [Betaproteobacteria bacterium]